MRGGAVVVRLRVVGAQFDGLGEVGDGVRVLAGGGERVAAVEVQLRVGGVEIDGAGERFDGLAVLGDARKRARGGRGSEFPKDGRLPCRHYTKGVRLRRELRCLARAFTELQRTLPTLSRGKP